MTDLRFTSVRFHLVQAILADPAGQWTVRQMTDQVAAKVPVPAGAVQDSLYSMMADRLLEAVPFESDLTLRLRHDAGSPYAPLAAATKRLAALRDRWRNEHPSVADYLPNLGEGGDQV